MLNFTMLSKFLFVIFLVLLGFSTYAAAHGSAGGDGLGRTGRPVSTGAGREGELAEVVASSRRTLEEIAEDASNPEACNAVNRIWSAEMGHPGDAFREIAFNTCRTIALNGEHPEVYDAAVFLRQTFDSDDNSKVEEAQRIAILGLEIVARRLGHPKVIQGAINLYTGFPHHLTKSIVSLKKLEEESQAKGRDRLMAIFYAPSHRHSLDAASTLWDFSGHTTFFSENRAIIRPTLRAIAEDFSNPYHPRANYILWNYNEHFRPGARDSMTDEDREFARLLMRRIVQDPDYRSPDPVNLHTCWAAEILWTHHHASSGVLGLLYLIAGYADEDIYSLDPEVRADRRMAREALIRATQTDDGSYRNALIALKSLVRKEKDFAEGIGSDELRRACIRGLLTDSRDEEDINLGQKIKAKYFPDLA